ncbi:MAG: alpha/beta hydrolase [Candidatus Rokubacteria bacterium]|nr:alpha/beta hydrolase [Candidatus Rokubacteria bacterium]
MSTAVTARPDAAWKTEDVPVAGSKLRLRTRGGGAPVLVLHRDIGSPETLPFHDALAERFTVYRPSHPGYDGSERPGWMRSVRDMAAVYQWLLAERGLADVSLVGLGFGGWIAAEMASLAPRAFRRLVLVGAMGIRPARGEILDQALLSYIDYVRAGFEDQAAFDRQFGAEPPTAVLEQWDLNREMSFRIAWKPYMYSQTLPHLLGGVRAPALVVWGRRDRIVPLECGEQYARALPKARWSVLEDAGHHLEIEQPGPLAAAVIPFLAES